MEKEKVKRTTQDETTEPVSGSRRRKEYVKPEITTFSEEELLSRVGAARACSGNSGEAMGWDKQNLHP